MREGAKVDRIEGGLGRIKVHYSQDGQSGIVEGTHLLVATGRKPNLDDLGLEAARIAYTQLVEELLEQGAETSNRRVDPSATSLAACSSRMSPTITPASSSGALCSEFRPS